MLINLHRTVLAQDTDIIAHHVSKELPVSNDHALVPCAVIIACDRKDRVDAVCRLERHLVLSASVGILCKRGLKCLNVFHPNVGDKIGGAICLRFRNRDA